MIGSRLEREVGHTDAATGRALNSGMRNIGVLAVLGLSVVFAAAQITPSGSPNTDNGQKSEKPQTETHITPDQAKQLFQSVDELLHFASDDTGLPIKHEVKRTLTTRADVEKYLLDKMNDDEDAKRMQRGEIVLKKFGLLDRDFNLKPFMLALLKEQIAGYYDSKTKTVYMLDWVDPETQKPVLVHELTHALQDQHTDLEKWNNQTPDNPSHTVAQDNDHLAKDELDTARTAALEGQAMAVFVDYSLKPLGKSLVKDPEILDQINSMTSASTDDSPVLARAPLLLSESLLFPYKEGLSFEQDVWMDKGKQAAFAGVLDRPPSSSWEVMNPRNYEQQKPSPILVMPDIHPLVDKTYRAYDIGQVGQLDLRILATIYGGEGAARDLTPAWDGGIYWAGQKLSAKTAAEQASTNSVALFYLSAWKSPRAAEAFARIYGEEIGRTYSGVKLDTADAQPDSGGGQEIIYSTNEGPVVITVRDRFVFVSESFDLSTARKLADMLIGIQGTGEIRTARLSIPGHTLSQSTISFLHSCGIMRAALLR
ncbi:hypothetical protein ACFPT7_08230 [Acidicapsa dinghuensis]|uniref:DUF4157 domain-containing protein n=1 Tax=Acidicapsa dinghuensis TaxID=2218256 RepID=A0ABW1EDW0_9BACT|nr:hypothetical protein [Acidicapsa dinghuensis]